MLGIGLIRKVKVTKYSQVTQVFCLKLLQTLKKAVSGAPNYAVLAPIALGCLYPSPLGVNDPGD